MMVKLAEMKLTEKEKETIAYYDQNSVKWAEKHGLMDGKSLFQNQMDALLRYVPKGRVLEIGSGYGKEASMLIKHFGIENYIGVDASSGLIKLASNRNRGAKLINTSIYELDGVESQSVDCFWASAVLIHLPKERLKEALDSLKQKLKTGAYGFISILSGNANMENSRPGRYYSLWTKEEFSESLVNGGYKVISVDRVPNSAPEGNDGLAFIVRNDDQGKFS